MSSSEAPARSKLLSASDVAERLGLSLATLARLRAENAGPAWVRVGLRAIRYPEADLDAFLTAARHQPTAA